MKTPILVTAFSAMVLCANAPAFAGDLPYLGEIMTVPYNFCPVGWLPAAAGRRIRHRRPV